MNPPAPVTTTRTGRSVTGDERWTQSEGRGPPPKPVTVTTEGGVESAMSGKA